MPTRAQLNEIKADAQGHTELMRAALEGDTGTVRAVLVGGAEVNAKDSEGRTALMFAVTNIHTDAARELLEHGAEVNATANDGGTALMLAASSGDTESVRALLLKGADPSGRYIKTGKTALGLAKKNKHADIVELLSNDRTQIADLVLDSKNLKGVGMPEKQTLERAKEDKREGKAPSTQAGEFVREEIEHVREGKHGARSAKQAIAIGLSKARRAGIDLPPPEKGKASTETRKQAARDIRKGKSASKDTKSATRSRASTKALKREGHSAASKTALSRQARSAAARRSAASRSRAAKKAATTRAR